MRNFSLKQTVILVSVILFQLFLLINSMFTVWPEMILYPYLLNKGFILYKDIINPYFPLLQLISGGFFFVFGSSVTTLKILTYIFILLLDLIIFLSSFRLSKSFISSMLILITFICLQISFGGNGLWFELGAAPFIALSLLTMFKSHNNNKGIILSVIFLISAGFIKQNAFLFALPIFFFLISEKKFQQLAYFCISIICSFIVLFVVLQLFGLTSDFINWAIRLPLSFSSQPGFVLLPTKKQFLLIFLLITPIIFYILKTTVNYREKIFWSLSVLIAASFAFPRFEDFHLQVLVVIGSMILIFLSKRLQVLYLILAVVLLTISLNKNWHRQDRFVDEKTLKLAAYISTLQNKALDGNVYLLNSPELSYFFANKLPPKPWGTAFPWYYENTNLSERVISTLDQSVYYVVIGERLPGSKYQLGHYLPKKLESYIDSNFMEVGREDEFKILRNLQ